MELIWREANLAGGSAINRKGLGWRASWLRGPPPLVSSFLHVKLWLDFRVNLG